MKIFLTTLSLAFFAAQSFADRAWDFPLYLDNGGISPQRTRIEVANSGEKDSRATRLEIPAQKLGIAGKKIASIRIVGDNDRELYFYTDAKDDVLQADSLLSIPVYCPAKGKKSLWIYAGNNKALPLPEYLVPRQYRLADSFERETFENGFWRNRRHWQTNFNRIDLLKTADRGNIVCADFSTEPQEAEENIFRKFPVAGVGSFEVSIFAKTDGFSGVAEMSVKSGKDILATVKIDPRSEWKNFSAGGKIPTGCRELEVVWSIKGTCGKLLLDNFQLVADCDANPDLSYSVCETQTINIVRENVPAWELDKTAYPSRILLKATNPSNARADSAFVAVPINRITNSNAPDDSFAAFSDGRKLNTFINNGEMFVELPPVEPLSEKRIQIYLSKDLKNKPANKNAKLEQASYILSDYELSAALASEKPSYKSLLAAKANLLKGAKVSSDTSATANSKSFNSSEFVLMGVAKSPDAKNASVKIGVGRSSVISVNATMKGRFFALKGNGDLRTVTVKIIPPKKSKQRIEIESPILAELLPCSFDRIEHLRDSEIDKGEIKLWQRGAIAKTFKTDADFSDKKIAASAAKNECESIHIALRSREDFKDLKIRADQPKFGDYKLPAPEIGIVGNMVVDAASAYYVSPDNFRAEEIFVAPNSLCKEYPDPVLPNCAFDLKALQTQSARIAFRIPKNAKAGFYKGIIELSSPAGILKKVPYEVRVFDFAIADRPPVCAIFDITSSTRIQDIFGKCTVRNFLLEHKLSHNTITHAPKFVLKDGEISADFTEFDKEAEMIFDKMNVPLIYMPTFTYFGWGKLPIDFCGIKAFEQNVPDSKIDRTKLNPPYVQAVQKALRLFVKHIKSKDWQDRFVLYLSDEPWYDRPEIVAQIKVLCDAIHAADANIKIYASSWEPVKEWIGKIDVWGVGIQGRITPEWIEKLHAENADMIATTDGLMCMDTPYCAFERILPLFCYKYGLLGYEFWGADWYTLNPYKWGIHRSIFQYESPTNSHFVRYPNGDGYLFYPPLREGDKPIPSIRIEAMRDGMEDYCYLKMLEKIASVGNDKTARELLEAAKSFAYIPNAGGRNSEILLPNPDDYENLRKRIGEYIEANAKKAQ